MLLVEGGGVLSWGEGGWGQTGHGSTGNTCYPQRIERLQDVCIDQVGAAPGLPRRRRCSLQPASRGFKHCPPIAAASSAGDTALHYIVPPGPC